MLTSDGKTANRTFDPNAIQSDPSAGLSEDRRKRFRLLAGFRESKQPLRNERLEASSSTSSGIVIGRCL